MSLQKKLDQAYDNGYVAAIKDIHEVWAHIASITPGIGPKLQERLLIAATKEFERRKEERLGNQLRELVENHATTDPVRKDPGQADRRGPFAVLWKQPHQHHHSHGI